MADIHDFHPKGCRIPKRKTQMHEEMKSQFQAGLLPGGSYLGSGITAKNQINLPTLLQSLFLCSA